MRKFKKGCVVVLALALSMSFMTGCGDKSDDKKGDTQKEATASDVAEDVAANEESIDEYVEKYAENVELGDYKGIEYTKTLRLQTTRFSRR